MKRIVIAACLLLAGLAAALGIWAYILHNTAEQLSITLTGGEQQTVEYDAQPVLGAEAVYTISRPGKRERLDVTVQMDASQLKTGIIGTYPVYYLAEYGKLQAKKTQMITVVDTAPPEISLIHDEDAFTRPIDAYEEEGYSASDGYDGDITDQVLRQEKDGKVYYSVEDSSGNRAEAVREIVYDDREPPVITLFGSEHMVVEVGAEIWEEGYGATDDCDGDLAAQVVREVEEGRVTYTVSDAQGNTATAVRTYEYVDTTPPALNLYGNSEYSIFAGGRYVEAGYEAEDVGDGNLTDAVAVSGSVNTMAAGDYTLTYSVSDSWGNTQTALRTVHVRPAPRAGDPEPSSKVIYLTFDDGPGQYTEQLLDILDQYGVKATFFVTAQYPNYLNLLKEESSRGHSIGIHSKSHSYQQIYSGEEEFFEDIEAMQDIVLQQTGKMTSLLRFPGGSSNTVSAFNPGIMTRLTEMAEERGYIYFDWNVASGDAGATTDTDTIVQNVIAGVQKHEKSVVLQHDIKGFSVNAVEQIIQWGLENEYVFLPLSPASFTAHHGVNN